jgi:hypothetical protein
VDAFLTAAENAFRLRAREYFLGPDARSRTADDPSWEILARALVGGGSPEGDGTGCSVALGERVAIVEEAARRDPDAARRLLERNGPPGIADPLGLRLLDFARLAGTAAHVLEAGARAARERGVFASSLMGCREVQEGLAGLASNAELLRLGTCRVLRLIERGDRDRASGESILIAARAAALEGATRAVALSLLGRAWVETRLAGPGPSPNEERKRS